MKICPVGAELFHVDGQADRQTDSHGEPNSRFSNFAKAPKNAIYMLEVCLVYSGIDAV